MTTKEKTMAGTPELVTQYEPRYSPRSPRRTIHMFDGTRSLCGQVRRGVDGRFVVASLEDIFDRGLCGTCRRVRQSLEPDVEKGGSGGSVIS